MAGRDDTSWDSIEMTRRSARFVSGSRSRLSAVNWSRRKRNVVPGPAADDYAAHADRYAAFLDQARWLLDQEQRRGAAFQQSAVALVGFDGVLLTLLVSSSAIGATTRYGLSWWSTVTGATLFALSAFAGVLALVPWSTYFVVSSETVDAWTEFRTQPTWNTSTYHFAHMLLAPDPPVRGSERWWPRVVRKVRALTHRPEPPTQVLRSAERLSSRRGRWTATSGWLLVGGVIALLVGLFALPAVSPPAAPQPSSQPSAVQPTRV
jgi:hypothetical protein